MSEVTIVGGGLAGSEAAWQLAQRGVSVRLLEMKPCARSPAHVDDNLAELVCSNSLRSANPSNAVGLLKEEMLRLDSLVMRAALQTRVPAGDALAVDRHQFALFVTTAIDAHPLIERCCQEVKALPAGGPVLIATGPLTADALAQDIAVTTGSQGLYFYDALAPIVEADSIDRSHVFAASRYGKGEGDDYLNCPFGKQGYEAFVQALTQAECTALHPCEEALYFAACLPVEVLASRGVDTLRYGAMKPSGLTDPTTGRWPYAVVQLRQEDREGQAYNLVGFQTKLTRGEQRRIFRQIPGLERASFLRYGAVHRNTFLDSPALLDVRMRLHARPDLRFAGQIVGVEGYVESTAHGLVTALLLWGDLAGRRLDPPPRACALGALWAHVRGDLLLSGRSYEPQNVNWSMFPPPPERTPKKRKKLERLARAREALAGWAAEFQIPLASAQEGDLRRGEQGGLT